MRSAVGLTPGVRLRFTSDPLISILVLSLLLIPRVYSILQPVVWVEDESYLYCAFLLSTGRLPYVDFPLPHFPMLESIFSIWFLLFGASIRSGEILTQLTILLVSFCTFIFLKQSRSGSVTAFLAAGFVAVASINMTFHLFAREHFVALFILMAALVSFHGSASTRKSVLAGLFLSLGLFAKLTAASFVLSHVIFLLFARKQKEAMVTTLTVLIVIATGTVTCLLLYGPSFLTQVVLFGAAHPMMKQSEKLSIFFSAIPFLFPLAITGMILKALRREFTSSFVLCMLHVLFGLLFAVVIKPVAWNHNAIELVPWLSCFAGSVIWYGIDWIGRVRIDFRNAVKNLALAAILCTAAIFITRWSIIPSHSNRSMDRSDLTAIAAFLSNHSNEEDLVFVPEIFALEANRFVPTPYIEVAGNMRLLQAAVDRFGFLRTLRMMNLSQREFIDVSVDRSIKISMNSTIPLIQKGQLKAVVTTSKPTPGSTVRISESFLREAGYTVAFKKNAYQLWFR